MMKCPATEHTFVTKKFSVIAFFLRYFESHFRKLTKNVNADMRFSPILRYAIA